MVRAIWNLLRARRPRVWAVLFIFCAVLAGLRAGLEWQRLRDEREWKKSRHLNELLWQEWGNSTAGVQSSILSGGKPLQLQVAGPRLRLAEVAGESIAPEYAGWKILLRFSPGPLEGFHPETLVSGRIEPPPGLTLRKDPTSLWCGVEYLRAILMLTAMVAWGAGIVLILSVRGIRKQVARWCLAAAVVSMFAAALAWDFQWEKGLFAGSHWFDTGAIMGIIALFLRLLPSRQIDARHCQYCRYDLTGNESGICPECGTETAKHIRQTRLAELSPAAEKLVNITVPALEIDESDELQDEPLEESPEIVAQAIGPN